MSRNSSHKRSLHSASVALVLASSLFSVAAEAQLDQHWKNVDTASQSNSLSATASGDDNITATLSTPLQFIPVTPCRVVDTRRTGGPIQGGTYRSFSIPQSGCNIPSTAAAYLLNVTVVPNGRLSYLTVYPTGENRGVVTTMNSLDGRIKSDAAIVPAGTNQEVSVYVSDTTNVVLDTSGYFAPASGSTLAYYPLPPCRVVDTRNPPGPLGGPHLQGGVERDFPVLLATSCNIPASAQAYSMNFTVLPTRTLGYLTVWPKGQSQPLVAILNDSTGTIVSNAAIVPAGTGGAISAYASDDTDLVVDINGYFAGPGAGGLSLYPTLPCRVLDTRRRALGFSGELTIAVLTPPGIPCVASRSAQAFVFNATVYPQGALNFLTLWPDGEQRPITWTLNAADAAVTSNMAIVSSTNGSVDAYAAGTTQLTLDISSYFGP
jgi:hypothetical protein